MPPGRVIIEETETGVRTTAFVRSLDEVIQFLATSTYKFKIIQPVELKDVLKQHLKNVLNNVK